VDVHQGDGTATICQNEKDVFTVSLHCRDNFPEIKQKSDLDIAFPKGAGDTDVLVALQEILPRLLESENPSLVLYDAGVDMHEHDSLGVMSMTNDGLFSRDVFVLRECAIRHIPVACVIGGGYNKDRNTLARLHSIIHQAAYKVWKDLDMKSRVTYFKAA